MLHRNCLVLCAAIVAVLCSPIWSAAQSGGLKVGEKLEGEIAEMKSYLHWPGYADRYYTYAAEFPIQLKAGQPLTLSATVFGKNRKVAIALIDPTGKIIAATPRNSEIKTANLVAEEVNATGKYTIAVLSDRIGAFSLRTIGPAAAELTVQALEARITALERELADLKVKLKALKEKSKDN